MRKDMGLPEDEIATSAMLSLQLLQMGLDGDETSEVLRALAGGLNRHGLSIARIHVSHHNASPANRHSDGIFQNPFL